MNTHFKQEDKEIHQLKKLILETPIQVDLVEQTMKRYESEGLRENRKLLRKSIWKRTMFTTASVLLLFFLVMRTGFISPAMAASIKQIPGMDTLFRFAGDLGLKVADEKGLITKVNSSDTHDGLTLKLPVAMFDGTRVSLGIERETLDEKFLKNSVHDLISNVDISINGEPIDSFAPEDKSNSIDIFYLPAKDDNSAILEFSDRHNQGGKAFPDTFEMTLSLSVDGIQEPFNLNVPVEKNTKNNVVLTPSISRTFQIIHFQVDKVEITPITTNITTRISLPEGMKISSSLPLLGYEILDAQGNKLKIISGNGWNATNGNILITDSRLEPFESIPPSITIKPYKYLFKGNSKSQFQTDDNGNIKVEYIPELEIEIPLISK
ncbi:DUF4179 domain-containing protein [Paenibacillus medicaginis]|uniref:DUF4179 domain-containing protein n=1 Tax=Paenibacillus medicaginis TaxID=1470560 RepID=A0ABV5C214_9BACL